MKKEKIVLRPISIGKIYNQNKNGTITYVDVYSLKSLIPYQSEVKLIINTEKQNYEQEIFSWFASNINKDKLQYFLITPLTENYQKGYYHLQMQQVWREGLIIHKSDWEGMYIDVDTDEKNINEVEPHKTKKTCIPDYNTPACENGNPNQDKK
jgi:hypothetical protein